MAIVNLPGAIPTSMSPSGTTGERGQSVFVAVRRLAWSGVVVFLVSSGIFFLIASTPDEEQAVLQWIAALQGEQMEFEDPPPITEQYLDWLGALVRFDWGVSNTATGWVEPTGATAGPAGEPAASNVGAILAALPVTLGYLVPSVLLAFLLALLLGYVMARRPDSWVSRLSTTSLYIAFSLPNFFLAAVIFLTLRDLDPAWFPGQYELGAGPTTGNLLWLSLPAFVLMTHLLAGYVRYVRGEVRDTLDQPFVTFVQAKGVRSRRIARHVFRYSSVPLLTLFVTELLGVMMVTVFIIEVVFEVPGIGLLAYEGVTDREIGLVAILTVLFALFVVLANLVQDLLAMMLDNTPSESVSE